MVEAEATEHSWNLIKAGATKPSEGRRTGSRASKPFLKELVAGRTCPHGGQGDPTVRGLAYSGDLRLRHDRAYDELKGFC
jgi:polyribonucleotide nucleotidyltransferase